MIRPEPGPPGTTPQSARELLERYTYGPGEIEAILRFADENNLLKDDFVWLLTAVLKVNTNLVAELLQAIVAGESWKGGMHDLWRDMSQHLIGLKDQLVGQIECAAARSAGDIAVQVAGGDGSRLGGLQQEYGRSRQGLQGDAGRTFPDAGYGRPGQRIQAAGRVCGGELPSSSAERGHRFPLRGAAAGPERRARAVRLRRRGELLPRADDVEAVLLKVALWPAMVPLVQRSFSRRGLDAGTSADFASSEDAR